MGAFDDVIQDIIKERDLLKKIVKSYRIQFKAGMRAQSLGLCKRVIKHALEDDEKILKGKEYKK